MTDTHIGVFAVRIKLEVPASQQRLQDFSLIFDQLQRVVTLAASGDLPSESIIVSEGVHQFVDHSVRSIQYSSPLEIVIAAGAATPVLLAVLRALRDFGAEYRERNAQSRAVVSQWMSMQEAEELQREIIAALRLRLREEGLPELAGEMRGLSPDVGGYDFPKQISKIAETAMRLRSVEPESS